MSESNGESSNTNTTTCLFYSLFTLHIYVQTHLSTGKNHQLQTTLTHLAKIPI